MKRNYDYFSEGFLQGLRTKSDRFQNEFSWILTKLDSFFYDGDEDAREQFHHYVESQLSYEKPGNMMCSAEELILGAFCGARRPPVRSPAATLRRSGHP